LKELGSLHIIEKHTTGPSQAGAEPYVTDLAWPDNTVFKARAFGPSRAGTALFLGH
jgi:hypothetical protein